MGKKLNSAMTHDEKMKKLHTVTYPRFLRSVGRGRRTTMAVFDITSANSAKNLSIQDLPVASACPARYVGRVLTGSTTFSDYLRATMSPRLQCDLQFL